jgi:hypothetical protein
MKSLAASRVSLSSVLPSVRAARPSVNALARVACRRRSINRRWLVSVMPSRTPLDADPLAPGRRCRPVARCQPPTEAEGRRFDPGPGHPHSCVSTDLSVILMSLGPHGDRQFSTASPPRRDVTVRSRAGGRVRSRLTSAWKLSGQPFLLVRSSARHRRRTQLRSLGPYRWSRNPSTVERWACGEWRSWYRMEAFGSGSTCRWRRSAVSEHQPSGRRSPGSCVTRSYAARTAAPPAQQVFGRGGGASTGKLDIVDGAQ